MRGAGCAEASVRPECPADADPWCTVRFTPLGSPTSSPNRSYVRVLGAVAWCRHVAWCRWVGTRGGGLGGYRGGVYRVGYYLAGTLVLPGPNRCQIQLVPCPPGTPRPSRPLRTPGLPHPYPGQYERDSASNILKLVLNPECHPNSVMRPGILPILKTGQ